jgi:hypothetical protein
MYIIYYFLYFITFIFIVFNISFTMIHSNVHQLREDMIYEYYEIN